MQTLDLVVFATYLVAVVGLGCWFYRKSSTSREFMAAGGSLPGWAVGLSIFGTFLSSITFLGVPGKAYGSNWNAFVFSLSLPLAAAVAVRWFVPFYRQGNVLSAYQHLEDRFGGWARTYASLCYLLTQIARTGTILFGVSLALVALTGWPQSTVILIAGGLITFYTVIGGIEAVIWTDVVQSIVLSSGAALVMLLLILGIPGGIPEMMQLGNEAQKFSLGSFSTDLTESTFWVVLIYGLFINLNNFGIDQSYVQRYHTAADDRQARRSVWLGALLYVPVSALFFLIGTGLYAFYETHPGEKAAIQDQVAATQLVNAGGSSSASSRSEDLAEEMTDEMIADRVFPHFIVTQLPAGVTGLLIAALVAAAMSSVDTGLNSSATVIVTDFYQRYSRREVSERDTMRVLYGATLATGALGTGAALAMLGIKSVLDVWWQLSGIIAGGLLGLFLLGLVARGSNRVGAAVGVSVGLAVLFWLSLSEQLPIPDGLKNHLHANLTIVVGTLTIFGVGWLVSRLGRRDSVTGLHESPADSDS